VVFKYTPIPRPGVSDRRRSISRLTSGIFILTVVVVTMPSRCALRIPEQTPGETP